jgi:phosphoserine aminotransferase
MYNTPPCYTMYISGLVFKKLLAMGRGLHSVTSGLNLRTFRTHHSP